jgi:hypothetical protein
MLIPRCFSLMHISMSSITSIFACTTPIYPWKVAHITWLLKHEYLTITNTHDVG